jgi:Tol biopolymer transport system component
VTGGYVVLSDPSGIVSAVPFDVKRLEVTGAAVPFADKLQTSIDGDRNLGVSASGDVAYQLATTGGRRLVLVGRGGAARDVQSDTGLYFAPRLSPDGKRVAVGRWTDINFSAKDVWVLDLVQHTRTRLTFDTTAAWPAWSRDGRRVAYQRGSAIYWVPADGSGAPDSLVTLPGQWFPAAFEPSGRGLVFHGIAAQQAKGEIGRLSIVPREATQKVLASTFHNYDPSLSPDGRWMAYMSDESGRFEIYVRPYPGHGGRWQVSLDGGTEPVWSPTGTEIFYRNGDRMMTAAVRTVGAFEVGARALLFEGAYHTLGTQVTNYDISRDGRTFVMLQPVQGTAQTVFVTLNWFEQLRRRP